MHVQCLSLVTPDGVTFKPLFLSFHILQDSHWLSCYKLSKVGAPYTALLICTMHPIPHVKTVGRYLASVWNSQHGV